MYLADKLNSYDLFYLPLQRAQNFLKQSPLTLDIVKLKLELAPCMLKDEECVDFSNWVFGPIIGKPFHKSPPPKLITSQKTKNWVSYIEQEK